MAFWGRWVFPPEKPEWASIEDEEYAEHCLVAVTLKGGVVVCSWREYQDGNSYKRFHVFSSFEEAATDRNVAWVVFRAREKIGVPVEELDI